MNLTLKHVVVAIILILGFAAPAAAGPLEDADAAFKRRDYATTVRLIRPLAEQGDANAQYNLGVLYDNGLGVPQDKVRAYMWFALSAAQGKDGAAAFRDLIARRMTPAQIAEAQKFAQEWKPNMCACYPYGCEHQSPPGNVRYWHKADIPSCTSHVRF